jgi:hypothetical protein
MDERRIDADLTAAAARLAAIRYRRGDAMMIGDGSPGCPSTGQRVVNFSPLRFRHAPS